MEKYLPMPGSLVIRLTLYLKLALSPPGTRLFSFLALNHKADYDFENMDINVYSTNGFETEDMEIGSSHGG